jgi:hypothetical protein
MCRAGSRLVGSRWLTGICFSASLGFLIQAAAANPCDGLEKNVSPAQEQALAPVIAEQLNDHKSPETASLQHVKTANVLSSLQFGSWSVLYVDTGVSDEGYLFYSTDPLKKHFLTLWAGGARIGDDQLIKEWEIKSMPGIPDKLASCFAWHVIYEVD